MLPLSGTYHSICANDLGKSELALGDAKRKQSRPGAADPGRLVCGGDQP